MNTLGSPAVRVSARLTSDPDKRVIRPLLHDSLNHYLSSTFSYNPRYLLKAGGPSSTTILSPRRSSPRRFDTASFLTILRRATTSHGSGSGELKQRPLPLIRVTPWWWYPLRMRPSKSSTSLLMRHLTTTTSPYPLGSASSRDGLRCPSTCLGSSTSRSSTHCKQEIAL